VRPVRGATIRLANEGDVAIPSRTIRAVVDSTTCYLVPRVDGSIVLGATSEEQGYDEVAHAGGLYRLLDAARTIYPGIDELVFQEAAVGLRPATEDHLPFVSRLEDPRWIAALGHYRNGILLCPLAALQVASLIVEQP
jgi:glycine oxidase